MYRLVVLAHMLCYRKAVYVLSHKILNEESSFK